MANPYNPLGTPAPKVPFTQPTSLFRYGEVTVWSTFSLAAGAIANSTNRLFTTPRGQVGQGFANALTIAQTSIKEGGRVPSGLAYDVFGVACEITESNGTAIQTQANLNDLVNLQRSGVLQWDFVQTAVDIAPVMLVGAGGGAFGALGNAAAQGSMSNGNGAIFMYRKSPVALPGGCTFAVQLLIGGAAAVGGVPVLASAKDVRVTLFGYYKSVIEIA